MYFFIFQTVRSLIFSLFRPFVPSNPCTLIQLVPVYLNTTTFRHVIFCNDTLFTIFSSFSHIPDFYFLVTLYNFSTHIPIFLHIWPLHYRYIVHFFDTQKLSFLQTPQPFILSTHSTHLTFQPPHRRTI